MDRTRDQFAENEEETAGIYEQQYSFLVTDGACIYLSDYASLEYQEDEERYLEAGSTVILCLDSFPDKGLAEKVEEMTQQRLTANSTMARYWSEDGTYWVNLTAEKNSFSVSTKGYGVGRTLPQEAGEDAEIYSAQWLSADRVQLMFTNQAGAYRAVYDVPTERVVFIEERS